MYYPLLISQALIATALADPVRRPSEPARGKCKTRCEDLTVSSLTKTTEVDVDILSVQGSSVVDFNSVPGFNFCNLTIQVTHPQASDHEWITLYLPPPAKWNSRFLAAGGGGLATTSGPDSLVVPTSQGYASGLSEGGLSLNGTINPQLGAWVLTNTTDPTSYNLELLQNFHSRAIHDLVLVARAAIGAFYGRPAKRSYYTGCSTGGRQGYFSAQYYPDDFDGILANAPVLYPPQLAMAATWPPLLMRDAGVAPPMCVFDAFQAAIVAACDGADGVKDGLVGDPLKCSFDANSLIGTTVACSSSPETITITATHAELVAKILRGPQTQDGRETLYYGLNAGASFALQAATTLDPDNNRTLIPSPFIASQGFIGSFVQRDPGYNLLDLTWEEFYSKAQRVVAETTPLLTIPKPDLTAFKKGGHKLLTWQGLADELVAYEGTLGFLADLAGNMGGEKAVNEFARVFFAPGVGHCHPGTGPFPVDDFGALVRWVEDAVEPDRLFAQMTDAEGRNVTRNLCPWPTVLRYKEGGDVDDAGSFECV